MQKMVVMPTILKFRYLIASLIIIAGTGFRAYQMDRYPLNYNGDDQTHAMVGSSLLSDDHVPAGTTLFISDNSAVFWFSHVDYFDTVRRYDFRLSEPYLDQPPMAIAIIGLLPKLFGFNNFQPLPQALVVFPALLSGVVSMYLLYIFAEKILSKAESLAALAMYSFSPYIVFASRQSQLENFLIPVYLLAFILLLNFKQSQKKITLFFLSLACFLAGFIKLIGLILPAIVLFWLIRERRIKATLIILLSMMASILLLLFYYVSIDFGQFIHTLQLQTGGARSMNVGALWGILSSPSFYEPFQDGWYLFGFLSLFSLALIKTKKNYNFVTINGFLILLSILFTSGIYNNFPWYRYPLLPFTSLAAGWVVVRTIKNPRLESVVLFIFLMLGNVAFLSQIFGQAISFIPVKSILLLLMTPILLHSIWKKPFLVVITRWVVITVFIVSILINFLIVIKYPNSRCIDVHCVIPLKMQL